MNMNRHHPYGGGYDAPGGRRGGPPGGFGPDRSHRFPERGGPSRGRGGFGRGRGGGGGYGGYDGGVAPYDQGPPQGDLGGYNNYDGPPQDPYYQNGSYNTGVPGQYGPSADASNYDQGYGNGYEDGAGQHYGPGGGYGAAGKFKRGPRRERDDKVHDSIIEERIQRERPCRTLFIRNIKYETSSDEVRRLFEEHGEIRTFFDLIANRGMVFVTYYDLRAAERARDRLQGSEISGRPIDVHYSLPRDDHSKGGDKEKNQQLQGTLLVTLKNSASNQAIIDEEVRRKFQQFGDVKAVKPAGDRNDQRYVEFFDTRAADEAHDRLRHQGLQDGVMDIIFAADNEDQRGISPRRRDDRGGGYDRYREWDEYPSRGRRGIRGGRGRGRGAGWGQDDWDRRDNWNNNRNDRGRFDDDYNRGPSGPRGGYDDRYDGRGPGYGPPNGPPGPPPPPSGPASYHAPPPPPPPTYSQPPPAAIPPPDDRLEQAKKVQQLLAALKQPQGGAPPAAAPPAPPTGPTANAPPMPPIAPSPQAPPPNPYYGTMPPYPPPPPGNMPQYPPPMQPQTTPPQPGTSTPSTPSVPNLPPNLLAMLQPPAQQQSPQATSQVPYNMPPPPPQGMVGSPPVPGVSAMPSNGQGGYQQLMAYLSQKRPQ